MTIIKNDRIIIDRGADVDIPVCVVYAPENPWSDPKEYTVKETDTLTLRLYKSTKAEEPMLEIPADTGSKTIKIDGEETEWLRVGRYYANIVIESASSPGIRRQIWPVEVPDDFGKVHKHYNFYINAGEEVYS